MTTKRKWSVGLLVLVLLVPSWLGFRLSQEIGKHNSEDTLMNAEGEPDTDNYIFDGQHLNDQGYSVWTSIIRPRLLADFPQD